MRPMGMIQENKDRNFHCSNCKRPSRYAPKGMIQENKDRNLTMAHGKYVASMPKGMIQENKDRNPAASAKVAMRWAAEGHDPGEQGSKLEVGHSLLLGVEAEGHDPGEQGSKPAR